MARLSHDENVSPSCPPLQLQPHLTPTSRQAVTSAAAGAHGTSAVAPPIRQVDPAARAGQVSMAPGTAPAVSGAGTITGRTSITPARTPPRVERQVAGPSTQNDEAAHAAVEQSAEWEETMLDSMQPTHTSAANVDDDRTVDGRVERVRRGGGEQRNADDDDIVVLAGMAATICALVSASELERSQGRAKRIVPKYKRPSLMRPLRGSTCTPWLLLLSCGTPSCFIVSINFTKTLLQDRLLPLFEAERVLVNNGGPYRRGCANSGRPAQLRSIDLLGLALWYLKCRCVVYKLSIIFGVVPSTLYVWLDYSLEVLARVVQNPNNTDFELRWPSEDQMHSSANLLRNNRRLGPLLRGVFGIVDGGRMPYARYTDPDLQNAFFEGYTQADEVTNLFVWNFYGECIHAAVNYHGSCHDSRVATLSGLYIPRLLELTPPGMAILGDSAFPRVGGAMEGKIIRARKSNEMGPNSDIPRSEYLERQPQWVRRRKWWTSCVTRRRHVDNQHVRSCGGVGLARCTTRLLCVSVQWGAAHIGAKLFGVWEGHGVRLPFARNWQCKYRKWMYLLAQKWREVGLAIPGCTQSWRGQKGG